MKNVCKMLCFVILILFTSASAWAKPVKVLTANVGNMTVSSASHDRQFKISEYDLPVLKNNLAALDPDIIFLQEIDSEGKGQQSRIFHKKYQVKCLKDMCTAVNEEKFQFIGNCSGGESGYMLCAVRILKDVKIKETCKEEKGGYVCTSRRTLPAAEVLQLFNVHSASPADDKNFTLRSRQISGMLAEMRKLRKEGFSIITAGDFNFDPIYESRQYNKKNDREDPLFKLNVCWGNMFSDPEAPGLKVVSPDEPTWFTKKVKLLIFDKQLSNSLDHVITNLKSKPCRVLTSDAERIDVDRTKDGKNRKPFMDHRAVLCDMEIK